MYILLNIRPELPCSLIYAWTDNPNEHPYLSSDGQTITQISFVHTVNGPAMTLNQSRPLNYDNDTYVVFQSNVPFARFCQSLVASEFNDPTQYRIRTHNCAYGAKFALEQAGIDLAMPNPLIFNQVGRYSFMRLPLFTLTPLDLYGYAKVARITHINIAKTPLRRATFQLELAKSALFFRSKQENNIKTRSTGTVIASELARLESLHPEHATKYIAVLIDTIDLLLGKPDADTANQYALLALRFRQRYLGITPLELVFYSILLTGIQGIGGRLLSEEMRSSYPMIGLGATTLMMSGYLTWGLFSPTICSRKHHTTPTPLSNAMDTLATVKYEEASTTAITSRFSK